MRPHLHQLAGVSCAVLALFLACPSADAVIKRLYPLADIIADSDVILVAKVSARDRNLHRVTLTTTGVLKGAAAPAKLVVALAGGDEKWQLAVLEQRLRPGRPVVLLGKRKRFMLGYTNGSWFRLAEPESGKPWRFVHLETYLPRTFNGSVQRLRQTVEGVLAGRIEAPAPDPSVTPGYGPP